MSHSALIDLSNVSVLCVDDDPVIRSVVRFALQRHGCRDVVQAHGGGEALDLCAGRRFDLIICDFLMSPMTGLDFLRELASADTGDEWPVIMLSAATDPVTIQEARELGVRAWVGKPVSTQTLIEQIGTVLRPLMKISELGPDPRLVAMAERHHVRLLGALRTAEESAQGLNYRPREAANLAHALRHVLNDIGEHARTLNYGLITLLVARATDLITTMERNPPAAAQVHAAAARALGTMITAMKRVAQNRMEGDGGEGGLKLLEMIDGIVAPVSSSMR
jgi:CheY-like chemotaxis protein